LLKAPRDIKRAFVEGASEQGGRIGTVEVELGPGTVDQALIVAAHELGHTLGASDHYVGEHTLVPAGLAEPDLVPQIPQRFVELMARTRPTSAGEVGPEALVDVAVGPATAREIGWVQ
jgi:hypothetical protein